MNVILMLGTEVRVSFPLSRSATLSRTFSHRKEKTIELRGPTQRASSDGETVQRSFVFQRKKKKKRRKGCLVILIVSESAVQQDSFMMTKLSALIRLLLNSHHS